MDREWPEWVAVSMGRRNTGLKPRCLVFRPEGFAGASEELAQQTLPMIEQKAQKVDSAGNPCLNRRSGCQLDKVASISIDRRLASLQIFSYSFDSKSFFLRNGYPTKCCIDRLKRQPEADIQALHSTAAILHYER